MVVIQAVAISLVTLSLASGMCDAGQSTESCAGDCVGTFQKCSGKGMDGVLDCCSNDDVCLMKNVFFSQCRPMSRPVPNDWDGDILTCDDVSPPDPCLDGCAETWQKCGGKNFDGFKACCSDEDQCIVKNEFFSQCRPKSRPVPNDWDGEIVDCKDTGVNVMCTQEENDPPIDVEIGSKFTIATTTTTNFEEEFPCEVVGSTMAPPLPLMGTVFASESDITRTLKCTITKGAEMAMCQFSVRLTGEPNVPATAQAFADDDAPGATPTPPVPPEPVFFIE